jgi:hypothetical protein
MGDGRWEMENRKQELRDGRRMIYMGRLYRTK